MCYNKAYLTKRLETMAKRYGHDDEEVQFIRDQLTRLNINPVYHASGFDHPAVPVIINRTKEIQLFSWGLIPNWIESAVEAVKISNITINARAETMFDKPAFREAARERRCLVLVDGFFEHHHKNGKAFPYHIRLKQDEPMVMGGLWDEWRDPASGLVRRTYTVVTTRANRLMVPIHNNPKASEGPRMPLILPKSAEHDWLAPIHEKADLDFIESIAQPYTEDALESYTVKRLTGKGAVGNKPDALREHRYPELETDQTSLF
ncbi:MAG: SOS response-associated peptidase [Cyclobacteriaceae bacterium]|nr:SOS response-associated peptidase [Cyclobacteriaceae bacterium]